MPNHTNASLELVLQFLNGESVLETSIRLIHLTENVKAKTLYQAIKLEQLSLEERLIIQGILHSFGIKKGSEAYNQAMLANNFYDLLFKLYYEQELYRNENQSIDFNRYYASRFQLGYLIPIIKQAKPKPDRTWLYLIGALTSASLGASLYFFQENIHQCMAWLEKTTPFLTHWLSHFFSLLKNFAILSIIIRLIQLSRTYYELLITQVITSGTIESRLMFATLAALVSITANSLYFLSNGLLTFPAALLFFSSALIEVIEELSNELQTITLEPIADNAPWEVAAQYERIKQLQTLHRRTLAITLLSSALMMTSVGIIYFLNPAFSITITCLLFSACVSWAKTIALDKINQHLLPELQTNIKNIKTPSPATRVTDRLSLFTQPSTRTRAQSAPPVLNSLAAHV